MEINSKRLMSSQNYIKNSFKEVIMNKTIPIILCIISISFLPFTSSHADTKITTAGSTSIRSIVSVASHDFKKTNPEVFFRIDGGGSGYGVKAVGSGKIMIGQVSREIKEKELKEYPDLVLFKIGMDGVAIIVNHENPLKKITKEQIQDIYTGKITNWKELGGDDAPIILTSKEEGRSALEVFLNYFNLEAKEVVEGKKRTMVHKIKNSSTFGTAHAQQFGANNKTLAFVSTKPYALGYVSVGSAQKVAKHGGHIYLLELDGVAPTAENVGNETYPLRRPLYLVTNGEPQGTVKEFISFLMSEDGHQLVEKLEFIRTDGIH